MAMRLCGATGGTPCGDGPRVGGRGTPSTYRYSNTPKPSLRYHHRRRWGASKAVPPQRNRTAPPAATHTQSYEDSGNGSGHNAEHY